jgi:hypothetical protein
MARSRRLVVLLIPVFAGLTLLTFLPAPPVEAGGKDVPAGPKPESYWNVDDVKAGMKGFGRTVMKGTKVEVFQAEILGVLKNTSPGRDLVLARLSGLDLEKTGVIAGMSGSPVYLDNKLLGAVAYAWPYGKEPIAGITPFSQMYGFVEAQERRDLGEDSARPVKVGLARPLTLDGKEFGSVIVSQGGDAAKQKDDDGLWLTPLQTPLCASGFTANSLRLLRDRLGSGMSPMQAGSVSGKIADAEREAVLEPGGPIAVSLITGDFDLSGIGTVTHVEGNRVYGFGHPFMSLGSCDLPMMTGYIHTIYPRQTVSFKMGSPLRAVGVLNADVSTCIAGTVGKKPDMMPIRMGVLLGEKGTPKVFNVQLARQRSLLAPLVFAALTNSIDMEGDLPEEMTAELNVRIEVEGQPPLVLRDTFSGFSGGRAPSALYNPVAQIVGLLTFNPYKPLRIKNIDCETRVFEGRRSADIEAVELSSDVYAPGETLKATVFVRPFRGQRQRVNLELKLPADLPEGNYTVTACDEPFCARQVLRENPNLTSPQSVAQVMEGVQLQLAAKRMNLALRVPLGPSGVAVGGKSLPNLPGSVVQILNGSRRTGAQAMAGSLTARQPTEWVVSGAETVRFSVAKNTKVTRGDE